MGPQRLNTSVFLVGSLIGNVVLIIYANHQVAQNHLVALPNLSHDSILPPLGARRQPRSPRQTSTIAKNYNNNNNTLPRVLAIYFPQYHRDPLNDKNWGDNFTDWISLRSAPETNRYGYGIPRPTVLGYYDLTDTLPRRRQGELARGYGVDGFIYHHYWFYDKTHPGPNLATPLLKMLEDGEPDLPFFFNWCATNWINVWMGRAIFQTVPTIRNKAIVLQEQYFNPSPAEIREHYQWLSKFFHHKNYILIDNQPVMLIYIYDERAEPILRKLRDLAKHDGFDGIYWIAGRNAAPDELFAPTNLTDRQTLIMQKKTQPHTMLPLGDLFNQSMTYPYPLAWVNSPYQVPDWCTKEGKMRSEAAPHTRQEVTGILTSFDNTPRRDFKTSTIHWPDLPENILRRFQHNLNASLYYSTCCQEQTDDRFVAINAWNEWGESMAIEPSDIYGHKFLQIIQSVKANLQQKGCQRV